MSGFGLKGISITFKNFNVPFFSNGLANAYLNVNEITCNNVYILGT